MSQSTALAAAQELKAALLDHGAGRVVSPWTGRTGGVSIELQQGRGPSSDPWHAQTYVAHLNHHTASATITADRLTPALGICKNGRTDLQGPLCNTYGGGDFILRVITLGWANHPGLGGPADFAGKVVPQDNGRPYLWGTEWDWPGLLSTPWPDPYLEWMARCNAGILDWLGRPAEAQGEHKDPWAPDRKVDRRLITRSQSIARTRLVWDATTAGGLHMDAEIQAAFDEIPNRVAARLNPLGTDVKTIITKVGQLLAALSSAGVDDAKRDAAVLGAITALPRADVDEQALAADLAPLLEQAGVSLDPATIAQAIRTDLAQALAS